MINNSIHHIYNTKILQCQSLLSVSKYQSILPKIANIFGSTLPYLAVLSYQVIGLKKDTVSAENIPHKNSKPNKNRLVALCHIWQHFAIFGSTLPYLAALHYQLSWPKEESVSLRVDLNNHSEVNKNGRVALYPYLAALQKKQLRSTLSISGSTLPYLKALYPCLVAYIYNVGSTLSISGSTSLSRLLIYLKIKIPKIIKNLYEKLMITNGDAL